jgi:methyl-accepting chemotaxis protein
MQELINSVARFSAAVTLYGVQQLQNTLGAAVDSPGSVDKVRESLDHVTQAVSKELDAVNKPTLDSLSNLSSDIVKRAFDMLQTPPFDPREALQTASNLMRKTVDATGDLAKQTAESAAEMMKKTADTTSDLMRKTAASTGDVVRKTVDSTGDIMRKTVDSTGEVMRKTVDSMSGAAEAAGKPAEPVAGEPKQAEEALGRHKKS